MGSNFEPQIDEDIFNNKKQKKFYNNNQKRDPNFPDMEEWPGERYKGVGIKRMKGYKCDLPIDKLNELRDKFWTTKIEENDNWRIIHQICVFDEERANLTLGQYNFEVAENCVNHIIGNNGEHYYVPNYCINDPYFEKELKEKLGGNDNKFINIDLFNVTKNEKNNINVSENITGKELINLYKKMKNLEDNMLDIRLLYGGGIIREDETLYQHMVKDGDFIQVSIFKKN